MTIATLPFQYGNDFLAASDIISSTNQANPYLPTYYEGKIILINPDQAWFWSEEWQAGERRVDEYIRAGNYQSYQSIEELLRAHEE